MTETRWRETYDITTGPETWAWTWKLTLIRTKILCHPSQGRPWVDQVLKNLNDNYVSQVWNAFEKGIDLTRARHKKLGADADLEFGGEEKKDCGKAEEEEEDFDGSKSSVEGPNWHCRTM